MRWDDDVKTEYTATGEGAYSQASRSAVPRPVEEEVEDETLVFDIGAWPPSPTNVQRNVTLLRERTGERLSVKTPAIIGRGRTATVRVGGNRGVSRVHAAIRDEGGVFTLTDLSSLNGCKLNGERIPVNVSVQLHDGDRVSIASEPFVVSIS